MTRTTDWIRPLAEAPAAAKEVSGARSRTRQDLFTEWSAALGFPGHFGRNWDAFTDCLRDIAPTAVVVRDAGALLADAPQLELAVLLDVLAEATGDDSAAPRLLLFLDDTPDRLAALNARLAKGG
ncbi:MULTISPECIES: barstar family protein [unclassified Streptomyces]|uniref:barstar family protein n=1 Tax=unclassified Streptomyces TaxID=2593676 RepID=UPI000DDA83EF|nr:MULTISPECIES: barstar family protein [unclassified Streptomyces]QZZ29268.1 barstar family protein [Streptomyces sp. ST1015]